MNRTKLKNYAPQARREFIQAMKDRAAFYGLTTNKIEPVVERGDVAVIGGREHPRAIAKKRKQLEDLIKRRGFEQTMEALAGKMNVTKDQMIARIASLNFLKVPASISDTAKAAAFIACERARMMTGTVVNSTAGAALD